MCVRKDSWLKRDFRSKFTQKMAESAEITKEFEAGEKILCFHGPLMYEAKVGRADQGPESWGVDRSLRRLKRALLLCTLSGMETEVISAHLRL